MRVRSKGENMLNRGRSAWLLAIVCGVVDAAANTIMLLALRIGDLSIVSALTALYPAGECGTTLGGGTIDRTWHRGLHPTGNV